MTQEVIPGGWTAYSTKISEDAKKAFEAVHAKLGVEYTPLAVATQVVKGINYSFFCNRRVVYPNAPYEGVMVEISKSPEGNTHVVSITVTPR